MVSRYKDDGSQDLFQAEKDEQALLEKEYLKVMSRRTRPEFIKSNEKPTEEEAEKYTIEDCLFMHTEIRESSTLNGIEYVELTPWERNFMKGLDRYFANNWELSVKQKRTLGKIYMKEIGVPVTQKPRDTTSPRIQDHLDDPESLDDDIPF